MKPRVMALLGALVLTAFAALPVLAAAPPGKVTVQSDGCTFTVQIDLDHAYDLIGWKVKQYNAVNWNEGLTLFKGSGPTDGNGDVTVGPFTAPEGHYTVAVDDEYPPDGSSIVIDFVLSCPVTSNPGGSEEPIDSSTPPSTAPSEQPTGSELPAEGSPPPSGEVNGITGTPRSDITPPPTDTVGRNAATVDAGWQILFVAILVLSAAAFVLIPGPIASAARATIHRRHR
jgi:hypothetical protein